jgi:superoxide reductase
MKKQNPFGEVTSLTKVDQVYVCPTCGNKVKVVGAGGGTLVCCGKPMTLVTA